MHRVISLPDATSYDKLLYHDKLSPAGYEIKVVTSRKGITNIFLLFQLPSDSAHLLDEEEEVLTFNDPAEPETNSLREDTPIVTVETHNYHDDSDEDLLA